MSCRKPSRQGAQRSAQPPRSEATVWGGVPRPCPSPGLYLARAGRLLQLQGHVFTRLHPGRKRGREVPLFPGGNVSSSPRCPDVSPEGTGPGATLTYCPGDWPRVWLGGWSCPSRGSFQSGLLGCRGRAGRLQQLPRLPQSSLFPAVPAPLLSVPRPPSPSLTQQRARQTQWPPTWASVLPGAGWREVSAGRAATRGAGLGAHGCQVAAATPSSESPHRAARAGGGRGSPPASPSSGQREGLPGSPRRP